MNGTEWVDMLRRKHAGFAASYPIGSRAVFPKSVTAEGGKDNRDIVVIATTSDVDLDDESVLPEGVNTDYFLANGSVFIDHRYSYTDYVGKVRKVLPLKAGNVLTGYSVRIGMAKNPVANELWENIADGHAPGASIGFRVTDYGPPTEEEVRAYSARKGKVPGGIVRAWDWLELSLTYMPCNAKCQMIEATQAPKPEPAPEPEKAAPAPQTRRVDLGGGVIAVVRV